MDPNNTVTPSGSPSGSEPITIQLPAGIAIQFGENSRVVALTNGLSIQVKDSSGVWVEESRWGTK